MQVKTKTDIGNLIYSTQNEINYLKNKLSSLTKEEQSNPIYQNIQNQIESFQRNMDDNLDHLLDNIMNNQNNTCQKLPSIIQKDQEDDFVVQSSVQQNIAQNVYKKQKQKKIKTKKFTEFNKVYIRDNKMPSIDLSKGLLNLLQQGQIKKNVNLGEAINEQMFSFKPAKVYKYEDHQFRKEIPIGKSTQNQVAFDFNDNFKESKNSSQIQQNQPQQKVLAKMKEFTINTENNTSSLRNVTSIKSAQLSQKQQVKIDEELNFDIDKYQMKDYEQVMDAYSLHQFMIRKGKAMIDTEEFISFKRIFKNQWDVIHLNIRDLEKLLTQWDIKLANIDGKKLAKLQLCASNEQLISCIVNLEEVLQKIRVPNLMFKGPNGKNLATVKIQSFFKMIVARNDYYRLKALVEKVIYIQRYFRVVISYKGTKSKIKKQNQDCYKNFQQIQQNFCQMWPTIKLKKRVEIHINSFNFDELKRLSMEKYLQKQNIQINRIFGVKDPNVEIIYVSPYDLSSEIMNYYYKVLEFSEIADFKERLYFVWPQNHEGFPSHYTVSRCLLYSAKTLKRIKSLIKNKDAYIVPGYPSNDDILLANELKIPILSGDPQKNLVMSTKSSAQRFLSSCDIPIPPGAYELYDEREIINSLTILIYNNLQIKTWILKIDDESNGRGIAYFDVDSVKILRLIRKQVDQQDVDESVATQIKEALKIHLSKKLKIATPTLFHSYQEYIKTFTRKGGIIEASANEMHPSSQGFALFFLIEPDGNIQQFGTYDKIQSANFQNIACIYPQQQIQGLNSEVICSSIGLKLYEKGIIGYVTIDMVSFQDPTEEKGRLLFWAIGLDCFLNNYSSSYFYFDFLMKGHFDQHNGEYYMRNEKLYNNQDRSDTLSIKSEGRSQISFMNNNRMYMYCPFVNHPGLNKCQYKSFFQKCRVSGISFDIEKKIGSTFVLLDSLQSGVISIMSIATKKDQLIKYMNDVLMFIVLQGGSQNIKYVDNSDISRTDQLTFNDVISKIRTMYKHNQRSSSSNHNAPLSNQIYTSFQL